MNILILDEIFHPNGGGAGLATYLHSSLLSQMGNKVIVITNRFEKQSDYFKNGNLEVYRLPLFADGSYNKFLILMKLNLLNGLFSQDFSSGQILFIYRGFGIQQFLSRRCMVKGRYTSSWLYSCLSDCC